MEKKKIRRFPVGERRGHETQLIADALKRG